MRTTDPDVGVVVLSQYATPSYALALLEGGSAGRSYLLKARVFEPEQLVSAIRAVANGGSVIDPKVVEALVAEDARGEGSPLKSLTARERDVLREMAAGKSNEAIGESLFLAERSVEKVIQFDLPRLRAHLGAVGQQARKGRDPLPGGERLASSRDRRVSGHGGPALPGVIVAGGPTLQRDRAERGVPIPGCLHLDLERERVLLASELPSPECRPGHARTRRARKVVGAGELGGTETSTRRRAPTRTTARLAAAPKLRDQPARFKEAGSPVRGLPASPSPLAAFFAAAPRVAPRRTGIGVHRFRGDLKVGREPHQSCCRRRAGLARCLDVRRRRPARAAPERLGAPRLAAQPIEVRCSSVFSVSSGCPLYMDPRQLSVIARIHVKRPARYRDQMASSLVRQAATVEPAGTSS